MNLVILNGRLVRDPELKYGQSGTAYSRFSIAVDRRFQNSTPNSQEADFINCVAFGKTAEFIGEYFKKGKKILLSGRLQQSSYEQDGKKLSSISVVVDNVEFAETKANSSDSSSANNYSKSDRNFSNNNFDNSEKNNFEESENEIDDFPF